MSKENNLSKLNIHRSRLERTIGQMSDRYQKFGAGSTIVDSFEPILKVRENLISSLDPLKVVVDKMNSQIEEEKLKEKVLAHQRLIAKRQAQLEAVLARKNTDSLADVFAQRIQKEIDSLISQSETDLSLKTGIELLKQRAFPSQPQNIHEDISSSRQITKTDRPLNAYNLPEAREACLINTKEYRDPQNPDSEGLVVRSDDRYGKIYFTLLDLGARGEKVSPVPATQLTRSFRVTYPTLRVYISELNKLIKNGNQVVIKSGGDYTIGFIDDNDTTKPPKVSLTIDFNSKLQQELKMLKGAEISSDPLSVLDGQTSPVRTPYVSEHNAVIGVIADAVVLLDLIKEEEWRDSRSSNGKIGNNKKKRK